MLNLQNSCHKKNENKVELLDGIKFIFDKKNYLVENLHFDLF